MTCVDGILRQNQSYEKSGRVWILRARKKDARTPQEGWAWMSFFVEFQAVDFQEVKNCHGTGIFTYI